MCAYLYRLLHLIVFTLFSCLLDTPFPKFTFSGSWQTLVHFSLDYILAVGIGFAFYNCSLGAEESEGPAPKALTFHSLIPTKSLHL